MVGGGGGGLGGKFVPLTLPGKFRLVKGALSSSFNGYFLTGQSKFDKRHGRASFNSFLGLVVSNDYFSKDH